MAAYLIAANDVTNPESMQKYMEAVGSMFGPFEGELLAPSAEDLAMGGNVVHNEGEFRPSHVVIIKFSDMKKHSPGTIRTPIRQSSICGLRVRGAASFSPRAFEKPVSSLGKCVEIACDEAAINLS